MRRVVSAASIIACFVLVTLLGAALTKPSIAADATGLPLPRFVSLRSGEVNMRTGPGEQYPIEWIYHRRGLPVEIIAEYHNWRRVRDWRGAEGWVHSGMLSGRRHVIVTGGVQQLQTEARADSATIATAESGVMARLLECPSSAGWCRVEIEGLKGWLKRDAIWGIYPQEAVE